MDGLRLRCSGIWVAGCMSAAASRDAQPTRLPRRAAHNTQKDHAQPEDLRRPGPRTKAELLQMIWPLHYQQIRCSIVVSISACHAEDPGSIPGGGVLQLVSRAPPPITTATKFCTIRSLVLLISNAAMATSAGSCEAWNAKWRVAGRALVVRM